MWKEDQREPIDSRLGDPRDAKSAAAQCMDMYRYVPELADQRMVKQSRRSMEQTRRAWRRVCGRFFPGLAWVPKISLFPSAHTHGASEKGGRSADANEWMAREPGIRAADSNVLEPLERPERPFAGIRVSVVPQWFARHLQWDHGPGIWVIWPPEPTWDPWTRPDWNPDLNPGFISHSISRLSVGDWRKQRIGFRTRSLRKNEARTRAMDGSMVLDFEFRGIYMYTLYLPLIP